jgi:hypothetical protein
MIKFKLVPEEVIQISLLINCWKMLLRESLILMQGGMFLLPELAFLKNITKSLKRE